LLTENLTLYRDLNMKFGIMENLEGLAGLAAMDGDAQVAARLFGVAEAMREGSGLHNSPAHAALFAPWIEQARARLGPDAFASEWAAGRAMTTEEAVQLALRADAVAP
jgi:hypothetical protein